MIDHEYTDEIVCPWCGSEWTDSWEVQADDEYLGIQECSECDKAFFAERHTKVQYSTEKAIYGTCLGCGDKDVVIKSGNHFFTRYGSLCPKCDRACYRKAFDAYTSWIHDEAKKKKQSEG